MESSRLRVLDGPAEGYELDVVDTPPETLVLAQLPRGWHPVHGKRPWPVMASYERQERRMIDGQIIYPYQHKP